MRPAIKALRCRKGNSVIIGDDKAEERKPREEKVAKCGH